MNQSCHDRILRTFIKEVFPDKHKTVFCDIKLQKEKGEDGVNLYTIRIYDNSNEETLYVESDIKGYRKNQLGEEFTKFLIRMNDTCKKPVL